MPVLIGAVVLLGLAVGSFLNVVIYRVPAGLSVVAPGSHCPKCGSSISNRHNVPVLGWIVLRGRCASCAERISPRYPAVELSTALLFVAVTFRMASLSLLPALPAMLYLAAIGVALALIDLDCKRLPNAIVLPSYPVLAVLLAGAAWWNHDMGALVRAIVGAAALFGLYLAIAFAYPAGMGFGDVKLAGLLGAATAFLSWPAFAIGAFAAFLFGGMVGIGVMALGHGGRKTALPFGPFMILGAFLAIFSSDTIWHTYTRYTLGR